MGGGGGGGVNKLVSLHSAIEVKRSSVSWVMAFFYFSQRKFSLL